MSAMPYPSGSSDPGDATAAHPPVAVVRSGLDPWLLGAAVILAAFGVVMIFSASAPMAERLRQPSTAFAVRQVVGLFLGTAAGAYLLWADWKQVRRLAMPAFILAVITMVAVFSPLGVTVNGATRWIYLGVMNFQPSEFAKLALAMILADQLAQHEGHIQDVIRVVLVPAVCFYLPLLVAAILQKDLGASALLTGVAGVTFFVAGLAWRWVAAMLGVVAMGVGGLVAVEPYRMKRLVSFLDPFLDPDDTGFQVIQGWVAMGVGGPDGRGLGEGVAQLGFLPEAHTDMISAVIVEELGVVGWLAVIGLLVTILVRGTRIATQARSLHDTLLASCIVAVLGAQAVVNLGVVVGWMPPKGLVLPLLSYGPSAVIVYVMMIALLLRIGVEAEEPATAAGG